jgi:hypothetical protein
MATIKLTFDQLRDAGLSLDLIDITVQPDGQVFYTRKNGSADLRATKPWGGVITDNRAKALFTPLGVGRHQVNAVYA